MNSNDPLSELIRTVTGPGASGSASTSADAVAQSTSAAGSVLADALLQNTTQLAQLQSLFQSHTDATNQNTQAVSANTTTLGAGGTAANIAKTATSFLGGDSILSPIVSGLMSLFGGGSTQTTTPTYEKYSMPAPVSVAAGTGSSGLGTADYGQDGLPRNNSAQSPNITVQVSAMDSQSFLDRSSDIASAVRRAMLESSSLNDVVSEL